MLYVALPLEYSGAAGREATDWLRILHIMMHKMHKVQLVTVSTGGCCCYLNLRASAQTEHPGMSGNRMSRQNGDNTSKSCKLVKTNWPSTASSEQPPQNSLDH